jgi:hypothetical protein
MRNCSKRAASAFPLVNYLPVAPVHEPECQFVNHVALVQLDNVDMSPSMPAMRLHGAKEGRESTSSAWPNSRTAPFTRVVAQRLQSVETSCSHSVFDQHSAACSARSRRFSRPLRRLNVGLRHIEVVQGGLLATVGNAWRRRLIENVPCPVGELIDHSMYRLTTVLTQPRPYNPRRSRQGHEQDQRQHRDQYDKGARRLLREWPTTTCLCFSAQQLARLLALQG